MRVNGNISGIKDVYLEKLEGLYDLECQSGEFVSGDILDTLIDVTENIKREISIFINRRGKLLDVTIGDSFTVHVLDMDLRRGIRRLSGIRCIHTHPNASGKLSKVDLSALVNLRLDAMAAVGVESGSVKDIYIAYLKPMDGVLGSDYTIRGPFGKSEIENMSILNTVLDIEKRIETSMPEEIGKNKKERALLVGLKLQGGGGSSDDLMEELSQLADTAGAETVGRMLQTRPNVDPAYYIGHGKANELSLMCQGYDVDTIIFDDELSGAQVKNLEEITGAKVIDRTTLILDIFASRAQTREGKLQVELAQLKYRMHRLIGLGKVLSRTGGGIGTRGPGEKKLETDRRHIRERINELEKDLEDIIKVRNTQRARRRKSMIPVVSLVGYTNSGKSTMRNTMSRMYPSEASPKKESVLEADMLFATLDPTTRLIRLPEGHEVLISDTVGFIRKLPHDLIDAFRATLEEVVYSDLLVHVVDSCAENANDQIDAVNSVLGQLNALDKPIIIALNKIDKLRDKDTLSLLSKKLSDTVEVSALNGNGIKDLLSAIENKLFSNIKTVTIKIPYDKMRIKSSIYDECMVLSERYEKDGLILDVQGDDSALGRFAEYIIEKRC